MHAFDGLLGMIAFVRVNTKVKRRRRTNHWKRRLAKAKCLGGPHLMAMVVRLIRWRRLIKIRSSHVRHLVGVRLGKPMHYGRKHTRTRVRAHDTRTHVVVHISELKQGIRPVLHPSSHP